MYSAISLSSQSATPCEDCTIDWSQHEWRRASPGKDIIGTNKRVLVGGRIKKWLRYHETNNRSLMKNMLLLFLEIIDQTSSQNSLFLLCFGIVRQQVERCFPVKRVNLKHLLIVLQFHKHIRASMSFTNC